MLNHTKTIRKIYEGIQRKIFYMIPEKWDKLYLYSSIIDLPEGKQTGELFFYYIPKGIFKKNPINVYEIPAKFNIDEQEYLELVSMLYDEIKRLRNEFLEMESQEIWSNVTISIQDMKFKIEYNYEDLANSNFNSYEKHIIWRYEYLGIGEEQVGKEEKEILKRYRLGAKTLVRTEEYTEAIYRQDIQNIVDYDTSSHESTQEERTRQEPKTKNQILLSEEEIKRIERRN